ncbi:MAG: VOC family protein [Alphaproteobacteria bacterium]
MEQRLGIVTLGVRDMARARAFYERLGWRASSASNESVAFFDAGGVVFGLYGREALAEDAGVSAKGSGFEGITLAHNARSRDGVDAVIAEAGAAGATVVKPAEDTFWGGYSGYFADPDGHLWEVAWNPHFPFDEAGRIVLPD